MIVNIERLISDIERIAESNATPGEGITRLSYSSEDADARNYLLARCNDLGMEIRVDAIGNIRARYPGQDSELAPLLLGSHIDSVRHGGKLDGVLGVMSALEVITVLHENGITPKRPLELVVFVEEEGTNFGTTMLGSKAMAGKVDFAYLEKLKDEQGRTAVQVIEQAGYEPKLIDECKVKSNEIFGMLELHIEQGIILEQKGKNIGIVEAICGMKTYRVNVHGRANHAGATPMNMRQDPMLAAAKLITFIGEDTKKNGRATTVATVGEIHCLPNVSNVIPSSVSFSIDIRDIQDTEVENASWRIKRKASEIEMSDNVKIEIIEVGASRSISLSDFLIECIERSASKQLIEFMRMPSGAVHDSAMMAGLADVGMIFIPSIDGRSHAPNESSKIEDIQIGANVLLDVVLELIGVN